MQRLFLILIAFILQAKGYTQPYNKFVDTYISKLRLSNIDSVIQYIPFQCHNCVPSNDGKSQYLLYNWTYLLWKDREEVFITKIATCTDTLGYRMFDTVFDVISFPNHAIFRRIISNKDVLKTEKLKPGAIRYKDEAGDTIIEIRGSHPEYTGVSLYLGSRIIQNGYNSHQVYDGIIYNADGSFRAKQESVNYEYNTSTFIYRIIKEISQIIVDMESRKSFESSARGVQHRVLRHGGGRLNPDRQ